MLLFELDKCLNLKGLLAVSHLEELITPVTETLVTVSGLLGVGPRHVFDPLYKEIFVFLQKQELPEDDVGLVEALALEPLAEDVADPGQVRDGLFTHRLSNKIPVFLRCGRHFIGFMF